MPETFAVNSEDALDFQATFQSSSHRHSVRLNSGVAISSVPMPKTNR